MSSLNTDRTLEEQIRFALLEYVGLPAEHVEIYATSGSVTLTGIVPGLQERSKIVAVVERLPGVKDVVSFLELGHLGQGPAP